jgi:hypothetical protein
MKKEFKYFLSSFFLFRLSLKIAVSPDGDVLESWMLPK